MHLRNTVICTLAPLTPTYLESAFWLSAPSFPFPLPTRLFHLCTVSHPHMAHHPFFLQSWLSWRPGALE
jgi:hypothetical protein